MDGESKNGVQELRLKERGLLELSGVKDVVRFDEDSAVMNTNCGVLTVEGAGLHVRVLDPEQGSVALDGRVDGIYYEDPADQPEKRSRFGKLFH